MIYCVYNLLCDETKSPSSFLPHVFFTLITNKVLFTQRIEDIRILVHVEKTQSLVSTTSRYILCNCFPLLTSVNVCDTKHSKSHPI